MKNIHEGILYYVDGYNGWMVVEAPNKRKAYSEGVEEFGRGGVREVRRATEAEAKDYVRQKGEDTLPSMIPKPPLRRGTLMKALHTALHARAIERGPFSGRRREVRQPDPIDQEMTAALAALQKGVLPVLTF